MFDITDIKIRLVNADSKLKAVASIVIDDCIAIHDIKILSGEGGDFIAMPSRKTPDGTYRDIIHPHQFRNARNHQKCNFRKIPTSERRRRIIISY